MGLNMAIDRSMYPDGWYPCLPSHRFNPDPTAAQVLPDQFRPLSGDIILWMARRSLEDPVHSSDKTVPEPLAMLVTRSLQTFITWGT